MLVLSKCCLLNEHTAFNTVFFFVNLVQFYGYQTFHIHYPFEKNFWRDDRLNLIKKADKADIICYFKIL